MTRDVFEETAAIVRDAGGKIIGRTKLQKTAYILEAAGLGVGFSFSYHHYGPYSEDLASAASDAALLGVISEKQQATSWGGTYSTYEVPVEFRENNDNPRSKLAQICSRANAIELELAATALFLAKEGSSDPWAETARRKPEKSEDGRLARAKALYENLRGIKTPEELPSM